MYLSRQTDRHDQRFKTTIEKVECNSRQREEEEEEEYKGKTDSNSSMAPNEAVHVATLYYYNTYMSETKGQQSARLLPTHPSL